MYLSSFVHREKLLQIAERWFCGRAEATDALDLTRIFIADGFVLGEMLNDFCRKLLRMAGTTQCSTFRIDSKGELRDALSRCPRYISPRVRYLIDRYRENPAYFYYETPINGCYCTDPQGQIVATYRLKRPKRIAEKANRRIAKWIFETVREEARKMAASRARVSGIALEDLITPADVMTREFMEAEEHIAARFRDGGIRFDRSAMTINDVGGVKIIGEQSTLQAVEKAIGADPLITVGEREFHRGTYQAVSLILEIPWDREEICRKYRDSGSWAKYLGRGIPESELRKGLEPLLEGAEPRVTIELILATFEAMVESELGSSIHEERIISQRDNKAYVGYIPMNAEFLLEYLFSVGFSPVVQIDSLPIKLWGRYLPDTLTMYIRQLYKLPRNDLFH
ncbi:MAG: hypothetical protein LLG06_09750 [Desulfobacteraceae bacterium]|nr:hypothetical protein [Desulfobacteraceae bacterium]